MAEDTVWIFPPSSNKPVKVNRDEVEDLIGNQGYAFRQGADIPVINPDGVRTSIAPEEAKEAFQKGYRYLTPDLSRTLANEEEATEKRRIFSSKEAELPAFLAGAGRGGTFGLTDVAARVAGIDAETLEGVREANPKASLAGEVAGGLATAVGPVGGAITKSADTLAKAAVAKAGAGLGSKVLGKELTRKTAEAALSGATEGIIYGIGSGITEAALGNPEDAIEHIVAGGVLGGALGGGLLLGSDLAKMGFKSGISKAAELTDSGTKKAYEAFENIIRSKHGDQAADRFVAAIGDREGRLAAKDAEQLYKQVDREYSRKGEDLAKELDRQTDLLKDRAKRYGMDVAAEADETLKVVGNDLNSALDNLDGKIKTTYDDFTGKIQSLEGAPTGKMSELAEEGLALSRKLAKSGNKAYADNLESRIRDVVGDIIDETPEVRKATLGSAYVTDGEEAMALWKTRQSIDTLISEAAATKSNTLGGLKAYRNRIDDALKNSESAEISAAFRDMDPRYNRYMEAKRLLKSIKPARLGPEAQLASVQQTLQSPMKTAKLMDVFSKLDDTLLDVKGFSKAIKTAQGRQEMVKTLRDRLSRLDTFKNESATDYADELIDVLGSLNINPENVQQLMRVKQVASELAENTTLSPIDKYIRFADAAGIKKEEILKQYEQLSAGSKDILSLMGNKVTRPEGTDIVDLAVGTLGYKLGGPIGGAIASGIRRGGRATDNPYQMLNTLTRIETGIQTGRDAMTKVSDNFMGVLGGRKARSIAVATLPKTMKERKEQYFKMRDSLAEVRGNPTAMVDSLTRLGTNLDKAPNLQMSLNSFVDRYTAFLYDKLPQAPMSPEVAQLYLGQPLEPSDSEITTFNRYVTAAQNPAAVVQHIAEGTVTDEEIETLRSVYPSIYAQLQQKTMSAIVENGVKIPYEQRQMLSIALDIPADPSMAPDYILTLQQSFEVEEEPKGPGRPPSGNKTLKSIELTGTEVSELST